METYDSVGGRVYAIENRFFGPDVTVAGLVTGGDLLEQLQGKDLGARLLIPQNMLLREEMDFLDDVTLREVSDQLGVPVIPVEQDGFDLLDAMLGLKDMPNLEEKTDTADPGQEKLQEEFYRYN